MSDQDREFLMRTVPNLTNTPGGNKQIIGFARALAQRNQQVAARAREYKRRNGRMDEGFFDELAQWSSGNSMFGNQQSGSMDFATEQDAAAAAAAGTLKPGQRIKVGGVSGVWQ
jgi:hypothetical protein